jgi:hypothetical protein
MTDNSNLNAQAHTLFKRLMRRQIAVVGLILAVISGLSGGLFGLGATNSIGLSLAVAILGCLIEILLLLHQHDEFAQGHYEMAQARYMSFERIESKLLAKTLNDVEELIKGIESDVSTVIESDEWQDRGLFIRLVRLDLKNLENRLKEIKERDRILLDTHQQASHTIICKTMREDKINTFCTIIDVRDDIQSDELDISFGEELKQLIEEGLVKVRAVLVSRGPKSDDVSSAIEKLGPLKEFYVGAKRELRCLDEKEFERQCNILGLEAARHLPEIGIYGDKYVYQGIPRPENVAHPIGYFLRGREEVAKHLELFKRCWDKGIGPQMHDRGRRSVTEVGP